MSTEILPRLKEIFDEVCDIDGEELQPEVNVISDLGVDSIDFLDITYEIDKSFNIKLPTESWIEQINSNQKSVADFFVIKNLIANIEELVAEAA
ncbi:acyl carrier protein [Agarilytica rhodophyticola]|uniref:acyl carrier protein n=1 Tax=Agarilytica rhodophyticola TaxID=1737490 RepID=UPI000B347A23|nr:acyl carrier protein [Agarilytica rhodophyticola]